MPGAGLPRATSRPRLVHGSRGDARRDGRGGAARRELHAGETGARGTGGFASEPASVCPRRAARDADAGAGASGPAAAGPCPLLRGIRTRISRQVSHAAGRPGTASDLPSPAASGQRERLAGGALDVRNPGARLRPEATRMSDASIARALRIRTAGPAIRLSSPCRDGSGRTGQPRRLFGDSRRGWLVLSASRSPRATREPGPRDLRPQARWLRSAEAAPFPAPRRSGPDQATRVPASSRSFLSAMRFRSSTSTIFGRCERTAASSTEQ